ncbi:MAG: hypothetical protein RBT34_08975, partial [Anaerolineaceae bacterium]|nr:hypothetical protein [Anaerolineaceae bacterium]
FAHRSPSPAPQALGDTLPLEAGDEVNAPAKTSIQSRSPTSPTPTRRVRSKNVTAPINKLQFTTRSNKSGLS